MGLVVLVALLGVAGFTWNELATRDEQKAFPPPGRMYEVDGHAMHMYCTGTGSPTLVLDAGLGDDWTVWSKVQPELSKTTRVCSFDRSGLGSSDLLPGAHDANTLADQLHALVGRAGIQKPFVLVGHSIAGLYARAYASRYPDDLAGMILIDSSTPDQLARMPKEVREAAIPNFFLQSWTVRLGIARALGQCSEVDPAMEAVKGWVLANMCNPSITDAGIEEYKGVDLSNAETRHTGPFGHLPILIFSEDPAKPPTDWGLSPAVMKQWAALWNQMQEELKRLSTDSRRIIAKGSGHYIQVERADLIDREVPLFIDQIRSGNPSPDKGTTKTE
ncbi:MAG TPA: alpha/beta hydrolase [Dyella sp.]|uniref:alpha/beta fold hydrolase n=1 Tax=Dyella sp. TaxID=1869338 RepID=UPI002B8F69B6|nr:alpha/beta hydrolase [Dyella sp.]HTV84332.1 alpha/beta hydrolase [Dyella sp.]